MFVELLPVFVFGVACLIGLAASWQDIGKHKTPPRA